MTIKDAINRVDALLQNTYPTVEKVLWLSELDGMVKREIIDTHVGGDAVRFTGYDVNTSMDTVLLVPAPYDKIYLWWLEAQIHKHNEENNRWNNAIVLYNSEWQAFAEYYNRNHMPLGGGKRFIF